ncbi:MaoC family dehydratase [Mycolicibacterium diernhoferi]|uniref:Enoyl-CoA hydratase n=1 Tax=Mycolicibacterium diernhoferi TaxID=1801 RepID=A0A1Q4H3U2_9MYCO|nr:MaoC family dehydratase [Mycolicibacterium diernhoferi]OJZ61195.1 enoyl-CoA hydratase [Mycolicibacterium diernhoferi]OPE54901.1 enoyl-CoA hydratase [Mycolicibacterium diernhoferi]PEG51280.1 enoyl-CoA hydratase [Mycolicibacterium diernhoferi]QYL23770.1 MaoC family dehydratase [Mycolicibacterium diernhoferi]
MKTFHSIDEITAAVGEDLGVTDWVQIDQQRVNAFAEVAGDDQWIHVDVERSRNEGPFGETIAHGFLTLSLTSWLGSQIFSIDTPQARLNYGLNKVRFPNPVRVGSRIRARAVIAEVNDVPAGTQVITRYTIEIDGESKPACVADTISLVLSGK